MAVGSIMASGTSLQKKLGIEDSAADHAADLADVSARFKIFDNAELRQMMAENIAESVSFLESIGVVFADPLPQPPHRKPRLHQAIPGAKSYVHHLLAACLEAGVTIRTNSKVTRLLVEEGRVVGVEVSDKKEVYTLHSNRGVILASGDVAGNVALLAAHCAGDFSGIDLLNPQCTGDGHSMAEDIGGKIVSRPDFNASEVAQMRFVPPPSSNWVQRIPPYAWVGRAIKLALKTLPDAWLRPTVLKFLTTALGPDRGLYKGGALLDQQKRRTVLQRAWGHKLSRRWRSSARSSCRRRNHCAESAARKATRQNRVHRFRRAIRAQVFVMAKLRLDRSGGVLRVCRRLSARAARPFSQRCHLDCPS